MDVPFNIPPFSDVTSNSQDTEDRKTGFSITDDLSARHIVCSAHLSARPRAALSRLIQATNSQYQDLRLRSQRRCRRGRPRGRPPRRPRAHYTTSSRQTAHEIDTQPSITSDSGSDAPTTQLTSDADQGASQVNPLYGIRRYRVKNLKIYFILGIVFKS